MDTLTIILCCVLVCSYILVFSLGAGLGYLFLPRDSSLQDFAAPTSFLKSQGKPIQKNKSIEIDDTKVVLKVDTDTDGLEKKFDKIADSKKVKSDISSSVNKLKSMKGK